MPNLCIIPARAIEDRRLGALDLRALLAVGLYTNSAGKGVWASQTTLAERSGMSRQSMNLALKNLTALGYITKTERRHADTGAQLTCIIDVILDTPPVGPTVTPPVSVDMTPPVSADMTQTTHINDPSNTTTTTAVVLLPSVPDIYRRQAEIAVARASDPAGIAEMIAGWVPAEFSWEAVGIALRDMNLVRANVTPRAVRKFCEGVPTPGSHKVAARKQRLDLDAVRSRLTQAEGE